MPSRIDDKTTVPLSIVAMLFMTGISVTATGSFWVSRVNDRLSRIEEKLGIPKATSLSASDILPAAEANSNIGGFNHESLFKKK